MFGIGSAVSGQAHTMTELIWARAFQGIGAGAMMSIPRATVGDIFTPQERGKWMGVMMSVFDLSSIIGPALGGWITDTLSWRWVKSWLYVCSLGGHDAVGVAYGIRVTGQCAEKFLFLDYHLPSFLFM